MTAEGGREPPAATRSLLLVVGSEPAATRLFSGIVQRLGFHVPEADPPAEDVPFRGGAEPPWVADFHERLLKRARVEPSDARPTAWAQTARVSLGDDVRRELLRWLKAEFREADRLLVGDPRLAWFLPLWRRCAEDVGAAPCFATVLRHPAAVRDGNEHCGPSQDDISRVAGWLNQALFTERATREAPRVFVRYEDLLDDWARAIARVGDALDLAAVADASWTSMVAVEQFVDQAAGTLSSETDAATIPAPLGGHADEVWELLARLADERPDEDLSLGAELDAARAAYVDLYEQAEAIARSSVRAAERLPRPPARQSASPRIVRMVPRRLRRSVPLRWRRAAARALRGPRGPDAKR